MQEAQIINDYRLGLKQGITEIENCFYIPVRVTGTGETIRYEGNPDESKEGEPFKEERLKSQYFTKDVLAKCASLPILIDHPKDGMLGSNNLKDNAIIGQTIDSWIQGDEIWALARVYDKSLLKKLDDKNFGSTSPGFTIFHDIMRDGKVTEGPVELNHLAFVEKGHWDQIEGSVGYDNSKFERIDAMAEAKVIPLSDVEDNVVKARADNESAETEVLDNEEVTEVTDDEVEILDEGEDEVLDSERTRQDGIMDKWYDSDGRQDGIMDKWYDSDGRQDGIMDKWYDSDGRQDDDFGPKHHEQPSEVHADDEVEILDDGEDEEILDSEDEEQEDKEREDALETMRDTCDSAHPSLGLKMPRIDKRETKRSVVSKFMSRNRAFVSSKYQNMRIDSMNSELADEILKDMVSNIQTRSDKLQVKKTSGFVPSKYGAVDRNF